MASWSEPGRRTYRPLRRLLATFRQPVRLDDLDRQQTRRAWEDWAEVRSAEPDRADLIAVGAHDRERETRLEQ